jgi:hypothetical protein
MPHAHGQFVVNCAGDWPRLTTDQSVSLLEELSPANVTVVARPVLDEEGIVRVAVIKAGVLETQELVAKEALNKCSFAGVVFFGVKTSSGVVTLAEVSSL